MQILGLYLSVLHVIFGLLMCHRPGKHVSHKTLTWQFLYVHAVLGGFWLTHDSTALYVYHALWPVYSLFLLGWKFRWITHFWWGERSDGRFSARPAKSIFLSCITLYDQVRQCIWPGPGKCQRVATLWSCGCHFVLS